MRFKTISSVFITSLVIFSSIMPQIIAEKNDNIQDQTDQNEYTPFEKLLLAIYKSTKDLIGIVPWAAPLLAIPPITFEADPGEISIEYLDKTEITIGEKNKTTGEWEKIEENNRPDLWQRQEYTFELILPEYLPDDMFSAYFDPEIIVAGSEGPKKTSMTIKSSIPEDQSLPKSITVWVNVTKWVTGKNLFFNPRKSIINPTNWIWFAAAVGIIGNNPFGFIYSGKRVIDTYLLVPILIKFDRYHDAEIEPTKIVEIKPDEIVSIPIKVTNYGTQIDTFSFRIHQETDNDFLIVSPPATITLSPLETGYTYLGVASPKIFQDPGTARSIDIQAYSIYDENISFNNTVTIVTKGFYVSEIGIGYFFMFLFFILIIIGFYIYRKKQSREKILNKPDKPWEIPEEKKYFEKLKEKDKEKYKLTLEMMQYEYQSSMLWYKNYCKSVLDERLKREREQKTKEKTEKLKKKKETHVKKIKEEKPVKKPEPKPEKAEPKKVAKEEIPKPAIDRDAIIEQRRKEKTLAKIKRQQEKQKRKLGV